MTVLEARIDRLGDVRDLLAGPFRWEVTTRIGTVARTVEVPGHGTVEEVAGGDCEPIILGTGVADDRGSALAGILATLRNEGERLARMLDYVDDAERDALAGPVADLRQHPPAA